MCYMQPPESNDDLFNLSDVVASETTFDGTNVSFYKLKANQIWPIGGNPIWPVLENYMQSDAEFVRDYFIEFCNKFIIELPYPVRAMWSIWPDCLRDTFSSSLIHKELMINEKRSAEKTVRDIRRRTRKKYSVEEKIRIVLEGLRGEESIAELCRREGINSNVYYRWSKDFLEAGKTVYPVMRRVKPHPMK